MKHSSNSDLRIVIIGAGMAGILTAIKCREAGFNNFVIYEKASGIGGTWRENTYPGIACDVPAHLYSYECAPNPNWSQMFAPGGEIFDYFKRVAEQFNVGESIHFNETVTACEYYNGHWSIETNKGRKDTATFVIAATGVLHHPKIPEFEGLSAFKGSCFHSARWDHNVPLDGKRIGVVGTGSTAVQITCALSGRASKFKLFQRSAQWIMPMENPHYSVEEQENFAQNPERLKALVEKFEDVMINTIANAVINADSALMKNVEQACANNLKDNVHDPALRASLTPDYRAGCKRLVFSMDFYEAIQKPSAELVTSGIERITENGVLTKDGTEHELDVLVLATGFHPDRFVRPARVLGVDGIDLDEVWKDRPSAYMSVSIPKFPNFFMVNGPNSPIGNFSLIRISEFQLGYILQLMETVRSDRCKAICASEKATLEFDERRIAAAAPSIWSTGCNSWYLDKQGIPMSWPWSYNRFAEEMTAPKFSDFELAS